jgi:hypothetical protein
MKKDASTGFPTTDALRNMDDPSFSLGRCAGRRSRLYANWKLKFAGIPAFVAVFFAAYFLLLRYPVFDVTMMPVTALDRAIGYEPLALGLYFSLWFYVSLAPSLLSRREDLWFHGGMAAVLGVIGLGIFFVWPTAVPMGAGLDAGDAEALAWLKKVDAAGNACPSLHVAFAVFSGLWLERVLRTMKAPLFLRLLNVLWCAGITYSTLATKQHVVIDVVAGAVLGGMVGLVGFRRPIDAGAPQTP